MTGDPYSPETAKSPEPPPRPKDRYRLVYRAHDETLDIVHCAFFPSLWYNCLIQDQIIY